MKRTKKKKKKVSAATAPSNSRELLIQAAQKVFSKNGYEGTSTRDIAKEAGVNISLISYHFQGKEGLYGACLEEVSRSSLETVDRVLKKPTSLEDFKTRFHIFIEEFVQMHLSNPCTTCIVMNEITNESPSPVVVQLFKTKFVIVFDKLVDFVTYAQKQKYIHSQVDPEVLSAMVMGCISHLIRTESLRKIMLGRRGLFDGEQADKTVTQIVTNFLNGILPR